MKVFEQYHLPNSVAETLDLLAQYDGRARIIAGGTDLLVDTQAEVHHGERPFYDALIDVTHIAGANAIRTEDGYIVIGCGVTHTQLVGSTLVQARATALAEACYVVGGPQVRNVATLCGNVAHALPAADGTVALMALGGEALVARRAQSNGSARVELQWQPLVSLFRGPGESAVDSTRELLAAVRVRPTEADESSAFVRVMRPQGVALPILGMAARVRWSGQGQARTIGEVALSAGPVAPVPFRAHKTEEFLRGKALTAEVLEQAAKLLVDEAKPRTSAHRASKEYRYELLPSLLAQVLQAAAARAS